MNLEYEADEQALLSQVEDVFADIAPPDPRGRGLVGGKVWGRLVDAGWSDLGDAIEDGQLSLGLAAAIFRLAGRNLIVDEFVSSAYLLSGLVAHIADADQRGAFASALRQRPGVLLGDGRDRAIPLAVAGTQTGYCFGASEHADVYRVRDLGPAGLSLSRWAGSPPTVEPTPELSRSVALVCVDGDSWSDATLDLSLPELGRLETSAMLLHSAALIGVAEKLLVVTRDYALGRVQFGAPIGSYQAVKHELADVFAFNTVAWNAILSATAEGADEVTAPLVARYLAAEAALSAARAGAQFHGGMGFTVELNVHLFLRTVLDGAQRFGNHDDFAAALGEEMVRRAC
jgi:hypothetical protein